MHNFISLSLKSFSGPLVHICCNESTPPIGAYQVNFNRLEIILDGHYNVVVDNKEGHEKKEINKNEMIYIPSNTWSNPTWEQSCKMISIIFSKNQVGFSFVHFKKGEGFVEVLKHSMPLPSSLALEHVIDALYCLAEEKRARIMGDPLAKSLLLFCLDLLDNPQQNKTRRSEKLYRNMCIYVQENFHQNISRVCISNRFGISTSHVSRIFNQEGYVTYADYVNYVRLDRAKFMLKKYNFKLEEIARRCGFKDTNYFCRVFKQKTGKTPSQYRLSTL